MTARAWPRLTLSPACTAKDSTLPGMGAVSRGQALAIMEAMKMEHTIAAPADGVVAEILYAPGDQVQEGAELLRLQAEPPGGRGKS